MFCRYYRLECNYDPFLWQLDKQHQQQSELVVNFDYLRRSELYQYHYRDEVISTQAICNEQNTKIICLEIV